MLADLGPSIHNAIKNFHRVAGIKEPSTPWTTQCNRELTMNLLSLLLLVVFALGACATVPEKLTSSNEAPEQVAVENQAQVNPQEELGDKKVAKRSYGWGPWGYGGYSYGWPWYGWGHGWYPGWYPSWPFFYGHGYGGYGGGYRGYGHGGWYKGW